MIGRFRHALTLTSVRSRLKLGAFPNQGYAVLDIIGTMPSSDSLSALSPFVGYTYREGLKPPSRVSPVPQQALTTSRLPYPEEVLRKISKLLKRSYCLRSP